MDNKFGFVDWMVVAAYLVVVMGVGLWMARGQSSKRDYFLGGRQMPWWVVGLSIVATETSALTLITVPAMTMGRLSYVDGQFSLSGGTMFFLMIVVGHLIGRAIIAVWIVPYYFKGDVYTTFQLLTRAFGPQTRVTASLVSFIGMTLGAGVRILVTAIPLMIVMRTYEATSWFSIDHGIVLLLFFALIYTAVGGIKAVVWTDMLQFFIFAGAGIFSLLYIPTLLQGPLAAPSGATGWGAVREVAGDSMAWFNSGFTNGTPANIFPRLDPAGWSWPAQQLSNIMAGPFNLMMGLIAVPIGIVFALGFDQLNVQRVLGCRNVAEGRRALVMSALIIGPQFLLFLLVGCALLAYYRLNGFEFGIMPWDPATVKVETGAGDPKADYVFPVFIIEHMPPVMKGFLMAAILAAAMSSVSSALSAMASMAVMDLWRPLMGSNTSDRSDLLTSRVAVLVCGLMLYVVAIVCKHAPSIFDLAFTLAGLTAGAVLGAFLYGLIFRRGHFVPAIVGMAVSVCFMVVFNMLRMETKTFGAPWLQVNWPWHAPIGTAICLLTIMAASKFFPANSDRSIDQETDRE
jgi:SSS family transporter